MVRYALAWGAVVAIQGVSAVNTKFVPPQQFPDASNDACHPAGNITWNNTYPPCLSQNEIEGQCLPPTDDVAGWTFQRDCMCKGSFFEDALGCIACKKCNALQGHKQSEEWTKVFDVVKADFCQEAAPTGEFGDYWKKALEKDDPAKTTFDKIDRCVNPGDIDVEKYYKATKSQGPGLPRQNSTAGSSVKPHVAAANCTVKATGAGSSTSAKVPGAASGAAVKVPGTVAQATPVKLYAAATVRQSVAVVTGAPAAPNGAKFVNSTVSAKVEAELLVSYAMASMDCDAEYVNGVVRPKCSAYKLIAGSEAAISVKAQAGAVDFGACTCAVDYLAPKNLRPIVEPVSPASAPKSAPGSVPARAVISIFSPEQCVGSCAMPAPAADGQKVSPSHPESNRIADIPAAAADDKSAGSKPSSGNKASPEEKAPAAKSDGEESPATAGAPKSGNNTAAAAVSNAQSDDKASPAAAKSGDEDSSAVPAAKAGNNARPATPAAAGIAAPAGTGVPLAPKTGINTQAVTAGAGSTGVSAAALAVAFAVYAL